MCDVLITRDFQSRIRALGNAHLVSMLGLRREALDMELRGHRLSFNELRSATIGPASYWILFCCALRHGPESYTGFSVVQPPLNKRIPLDWPRDLRAQARILMACRAVARPLLAGSSMRVAVGACARIV